MDLTSKKILIVDDDDNMREAMLETVRRMGVSVEIATDGQEGFEKASKNAYDLIVSDMRMPNVDGMTMMNMIQSAGITTPLCFVTAFGTVNNAVDALKLGAYDYILKPFAPEVIEELVRRVLEIEETAPAVKRKKNTAIFRSAFMAQLFSLARDVAASEATVLITGESGTGKEVFARYIHENSNRSSGAFVAVNCAALPENLMESELFGYEKGAFTGAVNRKPGKFELADGGTILLDELGEIPLHLQAKLLRVLQEKEVERLGGTKPFKINVRILATTNKVLKKEVDEGNFREDLYYRLNVISIELPPLRERKEDIMELATFFAEKYAQINGKGSCKMTDDAVKALLDYDWPGNVRELEHTIERAVVLCRDGVISERNLFLHGITINQFMTDKQELAAADSYTGCETTEDSVSAGIDFAGTIAEMERELIIKTLKETGGNRTKAADMLGITVRTLRNKLNEYKENGLNIEDIIG
ncbi:two component, sigma54 specific, transcriptional regulator, Fis family [Denitrovibrio acetiphilus DSM 12809]|uniref:Two component, sigma54 specific, transcriptional regulator, Fis family n=1 Tax=Denitrovibrio acetiphilus (strain DSM 12809 / NBRC 114555 / N2460) TaxID=522772 RepID=D4H359_DENA2|nr:sigma-54 dependent transcriptional regulator [Denitrovibrio acetiphilus]ADD69082.1 two component, sigma54 specific, transcriptional regulator, Fis family [Denitrovibrio acetiphilus DSM 12809]